MEQILSLLRRWRGQPKPEVQMLQSAGERGVLVFMPPLVQVLSACEAAKGAPLTEAEVIAARDGATCVVMPLSAVLEAIAQGHSDIAAETVWQDWQAWREGA